MTVGVLGLFLAVVWVGMQYVIVVFPDHNHLLFKYLLGLMRPKLFAYVIRRDDNSRQRVNESCQNLLC